MTNAIFMNAMIGITLFLLVDLLCFLWLQQSRSRSYARAPRRDGERRNSRRHLSHQCRNE